MVPHLLHVRVHQDVVTVMTDCMNPLKDSNHRLRFVPHRDASVVHLKWVRSDAPRWAEVDNDSEWKTGEGILGCNYCPLKAVLVTVDDRQLFQAREMLNERRQNLFVQKWRAQNLKLDGAVVDICSRMNRVD